MFSCSGLPTVKSAVGKTTCFVDTCRTKYTSKQSNSSAFLCAVLCSSLQLCSGLEIELQDSFFSRSFIARFTLRKKIVYYNHGHYTMKINQDEQPLNNLKHDRRSSEELQGARGPKPDAKTLVNSTVAYHCPDLVGGLQEDPLRMGKKHQPQRLQQGKRHLQVSSLPVPARSAGPSFCPMLPHPSNPAEMDVRRTPPQSTVDTTATSLLPKATNAKRQCTALLLTKATRPPVLCHGGRI
jgi:hypothetical protein